MDDLVLPELLFAPFILEGIRGKYETTHWEQPRRIKSMRCEAMYNIVPTCPFVSHAVLFHPFSKLDMLMLHGEKQLSCFVGKFCRLTHQQMSPALNVSFVLPMQSTALGTKRPAKICSLAMQNGRQESEKFLIQICMQVVSSLNVTDCSQVNKTTILFLPLIKVDHITTESLCLLFEL